MLLADFGNDVVPLNQSLFEPFILKFEPRLFRATLRFVFLSDCVQSNIEIARQLLKPAVEQARLKVVLVAQVRDWRLVHEVASKNLRFLFCAAVSFFVSSCLLIVAPLVEPVRSRDSTEPIQNHGSYPGSTPPFPELEKQTAKAVKAIEDKKCGCCGENQHVPVGSVAMNMTEWYEDQIDQSPEKLKTEVWRRGDQIQKGVSAADRRKDLNALLESATDSGRMKAGCSCYKQKPKTELLPKPPCDVFYQTSPNDADRSNRIDDEWCEHKPAYAKKVGVPTIKQQESQGVDPHSPKAKKERQVNHLTPKSAGGCPGNRKSENNLQPHCKLCKVCRGIDDKFSAFQ